jgi:hypothetical protein
MGSSEYEKDKEEWLHAVISSMSPWPIQRDRKKLKGLVKILDSYLSALKAGDKNDT